MGHIKPIPPDRQPSSEKHEFYFQGVWVPAEVFHLVQEKKITSKDAIVYCLVQAIGCTDLDILAKNSRVWRGRISIALRNLAKFGLVKDDTK